MTENCPTNPLVCPLLTDMYQLSMAYGYWCKGRVEDHAVFDLFFRKPPFQGQYCIFAGSDEVMKFLASFKFTESDIDYLRSVMPHCKREFFTWLSELDCTNVKVYSMDEGSVVFPKQPLMRVEGPLAVVQLLETTLLNLVNFPSLIATNAARMRLAAGKDKTLLEFGLRRAQGPDGGLTASKYSFLGGFDGTSNLLAGKLCGITVKGTHAHSFVMSYSSLSDLGNSTIASSTAPDTEVEFLEVVLKYREKLGFANSNDGELAAFTSFAQAFPKNFLALVDTYDTLASGILNFLCVGAALSELGYKPVGIRLDSGDLAYLSKKVREKFIKTDVALGKEIFRHCLIVASNDINEDVILSLNREGHEIDTYGIGTNLVTCQKQPALGCVFKLVEINGKARIKLSQEVEKLVIPGRKSVFRLYNADDCPLVDLILATTEPAPEVGQRIMCRHPFQGNKRAYVTPSRVKEMLKLVFDGAKEKSQRQVIPTPSLAEARAHCMDELSKMRNDIVRPLNATEYKTSVSQYLFEFMHDIWMNEAPIADLE